ncbi:ATP-binding protein [Nonomuraea sp. NPDC049695]|uniref:ATP-binding protein n=1 Tax=Nonomuraea sp. NPDC049695 TaxID=3154734 RepID=UPI003445BBCD
MPAETLATPIPDVARWQITTLRRSAKTPSQSRRAIRLWMVGADAVLLSNAMLVVCELVTNVVRHVPAGVQRDWVKVRLGLAGDFVRLEVIDPGTTDPEPQFTPLTPGSMQQTGRGLGLVAALAVRYGTHFTERGHRIVWADLEPAGVSDTAQDAAGRPAACRS